MPRLARIALAMMVGLLVPQPVVASSWGSRYGDPAGFCPEQSLLPASYTVVVSNDPGVPNNPEQDTFWGIHANPGYDSWYGRWYGSFRGRAADDSGWRQIGTSYYGQAPLHWNFADWGWAVRGHAKQYVAYYNWTFGGACGMGGYGRGAPEPYMADVYGYPVADIYVDSTPPEDPRPRVVSSDSDSISFTWEPVLDRGDGEGLDHWASGMDHYVSWITVGSGAPRQLQATAVPRALVERGLEPGQEACVHVRAFDRLGNGTGDQRACGAPAGPPPAPPPPSPGVVAANPEPEGLTGLESWLYISPPPAASELVGESSQGRYRVTFTPVWVTWNPGSGAPFTLRGWGAAGLPYPARSPVHHVYERVSAEGYEISAVVGYERAWWVWRGSGWVGPNPWGTVAVPQRTLRYPVRQAQSELMRTP